MTIPLRPSDDELMRRILRLEQAVYNQSRGLPSGRRSLGPDALRPAVIAGVPTDAALGLTGANRLPLFTAVGNSLTGRVYWRVSEGVGPTFTGVWTSVLPA